MGKWQSVRAFSAGGVLFRRISRDFPADHDTLHDDVEVVLVGSAAEHFWVLPKGTPLDGEAADQVAVREVEEETGIRGRIVGNAGSIRYRFTRQGVRYDKEVRYFLMEAVGGDVRLHDHEYENACWFPLDMGPRLLTHVNESALVEKMRPQILAYLAAHTHSSTHDDAH